MSTQFCSFSLIILERLWECSLCCIYELRDFSNPHSEIKHQEKVVTIKFLKLLFETDHPVCHG